MSEENTSLDEAAVDRAIAQQEAVNQAAEKNAEHEAWRADKTREGWTYGPTENADDKLHPCMLPYNQLTAEQQKQIEHVYDADLEAATAPDPVVTPSVVNPVVKSAEVEHRDETSAKVQTGEVRTTQGTAAKVTGISPAATAAANKSVK